MSLTQQIGYGRFLVQDFRPGELFSRFDGSLARLCKPQPVLAERVQVWLEYGTSNARKEFLHRTALAHAISEEQAWTIERRRKEANGEL